MGAAFFEGVNWDRVYERVELAPVIPTLTYTRREKSKARDGPKGENLTEVDRYSGKPPSKVAQATATASLTSAPLRGDNLDSPSSPSSSCSSLSSAAAAAAAATVSGAALPPLASATASAAVAEAPPSPASTPSYPYESDEFINIRGNTVHKKW